MKRIRSSKCIKFRFEQKPSVTEPFKGDSSQGRLARINDIFHDRLERIRRRGGVRRQARDEGSGIEASWRDRPRVLVESKR